MQFTTTVVVASALPAAAVAPGAPGAVSQAPAAATPPPVARRPGWPLADPWNCPACGGAHHRTYQLFCRACRNTFPLRSASASSAAAPASGAGPWPAAPPRWTGASLSSSAGVCALAPFSSGCGYASGCLPSFCLAPERPPGHVLPLATAPVAALDAEGWPPPPPGEHWQCFDDAGVLWWFYDGPKGKWWLTDSDAVPQPYVDAPVAGLWPAGPSSVTNFAPAADDRSEMVEVGRHVRICR